MTLNRAWDRSQRSAGGFVRPAEPRRSLRLALAPRADVLRSTHPRSGVGPGFLVHDRPARPGKAFAQQICRPAMPRVLLVQDLRRSVELGSRRTRVPARRISPGYPGPSSAPLHLDGAAGQAVRAWKAEPNAWTAAKHPAPGIRARGQPVAVQVARSPAGPASPASP